MATLILLLCAAWALGYAMGKTRSRDQLPREIYDRKGRRIL